MNLAATQATGVVFTPNTKQDRRTNASDGLHPDIPRWGAIPIRAITGLPASSIGKEEFPANVLYQFNMRENTGLNTAGKEAFRVDVPPANQVLDMYVAAEQRPFTEFAELARLENPELTAQIWSVVANPETCTKYGSQLGKSCATCWIAYLDSPTGFEKRAKEEFGMSQHLYDVALETAKKWRNALEAGVEIAQREYNEALADIDNKNKAKDALNSTDIVNMRHLHANPPEYKVTTSPTQGIGEEIAKGLAKVLPNLQQPVNNDALLEQIATMMAEQKAEAEAREASLLAQIEALKGSALETVWEASEVTVNSEAVLTENVFNVGDKVTFEGAEAEVVAKPFGKVKIKLENGEEKTVAKDQLK